MDDAARWVINEVLPIVRQTIPNVHFYIVGHGSDTTLSAHKRSICNHYRAINICTGISMPCQCCPCTFEI